MKPKVTTVKPKSTSQNTTIINQTTIFNTTSKSNTTEPESTTVEPKITDTTLSKRRGTARKPTASNVNLTTKPVSAAKSTTTAKPVNAEKSTTKPLSGESTTVPLKLLKTTSKSKSVGRPKSTIRAKSSTPKYTIPVTNIQKSNTKNIPRTTKRKPTTRRPTKKNKHRAGTPRYTKYFPLLLSLKPQFTDTAKFITEKPILFHPGNPRVLPPNALEPEFTIDPRFGNSSENDRGFGTSKFYKHFANNSKYCRINIYVPDLRNIPRVQFLQPTDQELAKDNCHFRPACYYTQFGCCPDNYTPAKGLFEKGKWFYIT